MSTTPTLKIYHVSNEAPHGTAFFEHPESWAMRKEHYKLVAQGNKRVAAGRDHYDILEEVFKTENGQSGSTLFTITEEETPRRSLSVGDVVVLGEDKPYEVGRVGFRPIWERNEQGSMGNSPIKIPKTKSGDDSCQIHTQVP